MTNRENIFIRDSSTPAEYVGQGRGKPKFPSRKDPFVHARNLEERLKRLYDRSEEQKNVSALISKQGTYLEFSSTPGYDLELSGLEDRAQGVRLLNVREAPVKVDGTEQLITRATVFVPKGKEHFFISKIDDFLDPEKKTKKGNRKYSSLVNSVEEVSLALLPQFWMGKQEDIPVDTPAWCEVWLRYDAVTKNAEKTEKNFEAALGNLNVASEKLGIPVDEKQIRFPERIVKLIFANKKQLAGLISASDVVAEMRRAPIDISFFESLSGEEQQDWVDDLLKRTKFDLGDVVVCLLDTGVNIGHPLLAPTVKGANVIQTINPSWGTADHEGHGTEMAGIAVYDDLKKIIASSKTVIIGHGLESVKILPPVGANDPRLYGKITIDAVNRAEIEEPTARRIICMAVTSPDFNTEDGSPTSWSAAVDQIASGFDEPDQVNRLFFISAGNVNPEEITNDQSSYHEANILHRVENPGQAWNAVTVGAYSGDITLRSKSFKGFTPVADVGQLSPFSSTSMLWDKAWPIKPEILLDGGNMVTNGEIFSESEDLSLLTTSRDFGFKPLEPMWGTSPATAQASYMAAKLYEAYPNIWPETVRALLIHSAEWTEGMKRQFGKNISEKKGRGELLRTCGYGIPNLDKAIRSTENSVNLIVQGEIQPFAKGKMNEMHFHKLPWPSEVLENLGAVNARLKVTLSYFIEPGPGEVGWRNKYRYPSAGLRFDVINTNESYSDFQKRINAKMREDKDDKGDGNSRDWYLGVSNRNRGSIHSDYIETSAADLRDANYVAVFPVVGWWRERAYLGKSNSKMRYSLVVTIETPSAKEDLYTAIINQIAIPNTIEVPTELRKPDR
jgi:hypothetical protein